MTHGVDNTQSVIDPFGVSQFGLNQPTVAPGAGGLQSFPDEAWQGYINAAHKAINDNEAEVAAWWRLQEEWIDRREARLRAALVAALLLWPFGRDGRLDRSQRGLVRAARRKAAKLISRFEDDVTRRLAGRLGARTVDARREFRGTSRSVVWSHAREARVTHVTQAHRRAWATIARLEREEAREARRIIRVEVPKQIGPPPRDGGGPTGGGRGPGRGRGRGRGGPDLAELENYFRRRALSLGVLLPDEVDEFWAGVDELLPEMERAEREARERGERDVADSAIPELVSDAVINPVANVRFQARQMREGLLSLSRGRPHRSEVVEHINGHAMRSATSGTPHRPGGLVMNRNNLRLSVETHARAAYRSEIIRHAEGRGIKRFLLQTPASRLGNIRPGGAIGRNIHKIHTADEWRNIVRGMNAGRRTSSVWDVSGMHHNDFSIWLPVPLLYMTAASAWAASQLKKHRRRAA